MSEGSNIDPRKLVGESGSDALKHRDFFWDSIILYSVAIILALAGVDAIAEFVRGSSVVCRSGSDGDYINNYCAGSLPATEYIPAIIFIYGLVIAIPHYIWVATYAGQFDYFFSVVKQLDRSKDEKTKLFNKESIALVRELSYAFTTYGRNSMLWLYRLKLVFQLVVAVGFFVFVIVFFTEFDVVFLCPRNNATDDPFWPLDESVECVYTSMRLFWWVRVVYLILVCFIMIAIVWGSLWSISGHPEELGAESVAQFSFQSGIPPRFYRSSFYKYCRCVNGTILARIPLPFKRPTIWSDLDFLLLKLFRTDAGVGRVFRAMLIEMEMITLIEKDQKMLSLHYRKQNEHKNLLLKEEEYDIKWKFPLLGESVYRFANAKRSTESLIDVPQSIRGALLGISSFSNCNSGALCITFGSSGIHLGLARIFERVGSIQFLDFERDLTNMQEAQDKVEPAVVPDTSQIQNEQDRRILNILHGILDAVQNPKREEEEPPINKYVSKKNFLSSIITYTAPENILTADIDLASQFIGRLESIWKISDEFTKKSMLIVIGPMTSDAQRLSVSILLYHVRQYIGNGCLILFLKPIKIGGQKCKPGKSFQDWAPPDDTGLKLEAIPFDVHPVIGHQEWPPQVRARSNPVENPTLEFLCGDILCKFEVKLYKYSKPTITVFGATELQGTHVMRYMPTRKDDLEFRGITTDLNEDTAKDWKKKFKGADLQTVDFNNRSSVEAAIRGSYGVFFFTGFLDQGADNEEEEIRRGKMIADICSEANVKHVVYSYMGPIEGDHQNMPAPTPSQAIQDHIRSLDLRYTFVYTSAYYEVFAMDSLYSKQQDGTYMYNTTMLAQTPIDAISIDDSSAIIVKAIFCQPEYIGKEVRLVGDQRTVEEYVGIIGSVLGETIYVKGSSATEQTDGGYDLEQDKALTRKLRPRVKPFDGWVQKKQPIVNLPS